MKILIVANYAKEHVNKFHTETIRRFKERGWTVDVACRADEEVPCCDRLFDIGCTRNPFSFKSLSAVKKLKKIIAENNYDVVHCHTLAGRYIGAAAAKQFVNKGLILAATYHGFNFYKGSSILTKVLIPVEKHMAKNLSAAFFVNRADMEYAGRLKIKNCRFCPPNVKGENFAETTKLRAERDETRKELGVSPDGILLAYVAEINKNKNQRLLLGALSELKKKYKEVKLLLIGPDHTDGKFERTVNKKGLSDCVIMTGWRDDVCRLLCAADVYTASSIREGFGVNLLEASICGLPVIATKNRGHSEIISDGFNGYLCPKNSPSFFAEKVSAVIDDKATADKFVINGKALYEENFSENRSDMIIDALLPLVKIKC